MPLRVLFERPTIAGQAEFIEDFQKKSEKAGSKDVNRFLAELEEISDEDVYRRLKMKMKKKK